MLVTAYNYLGERRYIVIQNFVYNTYMYTKDLYTILNCNLRAFTEMRCEKQIHTVEKQQRNIKYAIIIMHVKYCINRI